MRNRVPNRSVFALIICAIAVISTTLSSGYISPAVLGDDNVSIQPLSSMTGTELRSASGSVALTSSSSTTTIISSSTPAAEIHVEPASRSVTAGGYVTYDIDIRQQGTANVFLATKGVPPMSVAIFSQDSGVAAPEFRSTLTIVTSANTPATTYNIVVVSLVNGQEYDTPVSLQVSSVTTTTQTNNTITVPSGTSLSLILDTDMHRYDPNATVHLQGHVADGSGNVIANATVNVQVDSPTGLEILALKNIRTDSAGVFRASFTFPRFTQTGTYTAFASANKQGYVSATTRTTFVVETSSTPSVVIQAVYTGDSSGSPITVFSPGQTVYVWVVIENVGPTFRGVIWVQVRDPNGSPVQVLMRVSSLTSGETFRDGFGFTLLGKLTPGLYTVNALISDNLISQGGVFLASSSMQFAVTTS